MARAGFQVELDQTATLELERQLVSLLELECRLLSDLCKLVCAYVPETISVLTLCPDRRLTILWSVDELKWQIIPPPHRQPWTLELHNCSRGQLQPGLVFLCLSFLVAVLLVYVACVIDLWISSNFAVGLVLLACTLWISVAMKLLPDELLSVTFRICPRDIRGKERSVTSITGSLRTARFLCFRRGRFAQQDREFTKCSVRLDAVSASYSCPLDHGVLSMSPTLEQERDRSGSLRLRLATDRAGCWELARGAGHVPSELLMLARRYLQTIVTGHAWQLATAEDNPLLKETTTLPFFVTPRSFFADLAARMQGVTTDEVENALTHHS